MAKKRRASSSSKAKKKAAGTKRRSSAKKTVKGVDFNPVKRQLAAHIARLEKQYGAGAVAVDSRQQEIVAKLRGLQRELSDLCAPTMTLEAP